jgi:hypothetical protein
MTASFTHIVNPFPGRPGSEHAVASRITWATLAVAYERAQRAGIEVFVRAVVLPGDESAVQPPASSVVYLERTVADVAVLKPHRKLPLIGDLLRTGSEAVTSSHVIFTNMDIAVQPAFYVRVAELVADVGEGVPFMLPRVNVPAELAAAPLDDLYAADGPHDVAPVADRVLVFLSQWVEHEVLAAHARGVALRFITDNDKETDAGSDVTRLRAAGVPTAVDRTDAHMHHKFAIFDGQWLLNGSYNWTRSASSHNEENLVVTNDAALLRQFQGAFDQLWSSLSQ